MKNYSQYFHDKQRLDGTSFICKTDDCPESVSELVYDIHSELDSLPNDWIYGEIADAFDDLAENNINDIPIEPDATYSTLFKWFYENSFAVCMCDEAQETCEKQYATVTDLINEGQWYCRDLIYRRVNEFLEDHKNDDDLEEEKSDV
jgi:hypothetical protein